MSELEAELRANQAAQWAAMQILMRNITNLAAEIDNLKQRLTMHEGTVAITEMNDGYRVLH